MDLADDLESELFRQEVRAWLRQHLVGEFLQLRGRGGPSEVELWDLTLDWERRLAAGGWVGLDWPAEYGGRAVSAMHKVIFQQEYAAADAPARVTYLGEDLFAPALIAHGSPALKDRFLPGIRDAAELWCQGYSEPGAGSDLAAIRTKATLDGDRWVINGQKVWTSLAQHADYCFALCRTEPRLDRHRGLSYLVIPMEQSGVSVRPIRQMTGTSEFNEVWFDDASTPRHWVVGNVHGGWKVAMSQLNVERGRRLASFPLWQREFELLRAAAAHSGTDTDANVRQRLAQSYADLEVMRFNNLRTLTRMARGSHAGVESSIGKLAWSVWHQRLGELAMDVHGPSSQLAAPSGSELQAVQRSFLYSRAETIFAGSSEIQRNIIAERVLGLPR